MLSLVVKAIRGALWALCGQKRLEPRPSAAANTSGENLRGVGSVGLRRPFLFVLAGAAPQNCGEPALPKSGKIYPPRRLGADFSMKVTCERSYLAQALGVAGRAVSSRNTLPILSHVLLETEDDRLKITTTDLDTAIRCAIPASIAENGSVALPASSLSDYISKLPDAPVTLEMQDGKVVVRCGHSRYTLMSAPAEDFPVVPEVEHGTEITVSSATLKEMIRLTAFAASKEESRSLLMGVLFEARGLDFDFGGDRYSPISVETNHFNDGN